MRCHPFLEDCWCLERFKAQLRGVIKVNQIHHKRTGWNPNYGILCVYLCASKPYSLRAPAYYEFTFSTHLYLIKGTIQDPGAIRWYHGGLGHQSCSSHMFTSSSRWRVYPYDRHAPWLISPRHGNKLATGRSGWSTTSGDLWIRHGLLHHPLST